MGSGDKKQRRFFVGQTGEHYVLFRLSDAQLIASLAPSGTPRVDILVFDPSSRVAATIQVKTRAKSKDGGWFIKGKDAKFVPDFHFFVFVDLEDRTEGVPASYVVPSKVVADVIRRLQNQDPKIINRVEGGLFGDLRNPKSSIDIYRLLLILRDPPPDLTVHWMTDRFRDVYWLISLPLFQLRPRRSTPPETEEP